MQESEKTMFGYVTADRTRLTQDQLYRYQACYCGLCSCIGAQYGNVPRLALNYDMAFLVLLQASLYEPEETTVLRRCAAHPLHPRTRMTSDATSYAAAMNMALAYHKCLDDWNDDRKLSALALSGVLRRSAEQVKDLYPRQWQAITTCMQTLKQLEQDNCQEPDDGANAFGTLMAELFVWKEDRWSGLLRQMGAALGRFIYLTDAVLDLPDDIRRDRYNPLSSRYQEDCIEAYLPVLKLLLGECTEAFERLPLLQDLDLLRNILYSGVWTCLRASKSGKEEHHV